MSAIKGAAITASVVLACAAAWLALHHECAYGGGMPGWYRDCTCRGIERLDIDQTAADGPRRTVCIGVVTGRTCYGHRGGPTVACSSLPPR